MNLSTLKLILIITVSITALCIPTIQGFAVTPGKVTKTYHDLREFARARVDRIEKITSRSGPQVEEIRVHMTIIDGKRKGEGHVSVYRGQDDMPRDMFYRQGDKVFIGISLQPGSDADEYISIYDVDNTPGIIVLLVLLAGSIIAVGRLKGALSMLSLVATIVLIFYVLIPLTLKGYSPLPMTVTISVFAIVLTVPVIAGFKIKTAAAIIGSISGVLLATLLSLLSGKMMHLSGIVTNEMLTVFYASSAEVNLHGLALAGIVIAALGAIMDVCISIASATEEIFRLNPAISLREAFRSVFTVSGDMLGATVNTLLFAYVGSSLPLVLLIAMRMEPGVPFWLVFNHNPVLSELVKSAVGCIGMFLSMPVTAFFCIELHRRKRDQR